MTEKVTKPDLFENTDKYLKNIGDNLSQDIINRAAVVASQFGLNPKVSPHYLEVTAQRANKHGVVDLKPFFKASPFAKRSKSGGWYLVVPIRRKVDGMSNALYRQAHSIVIPPSKLSGTSTVSLLYENRSSNSTISYANYTPVSKNLTRISQGSKSMYVSFRTVSDKTSPSAWILNRDRINEDNFSKTMINNMDRMFKQMVEKVGDL